MKILKWIPIVGVFVPTKYCGYADTIYQGIMAYLLLEWLNIL